MSTILEELSSMPEFLERAARRMGDGSARRPGPGESFSFVEHAWHLADLEREGFGERIRRLLVEDEPFLPDFEGDRIARERKYATLDLAEGVSRFRDAREENLRALGKVTSEEWERMGVLEGHGPLSLRELAIRMAEHDRSHREEIQTLRMDDGRT